MADNFRQDLSGFANSSTAAGQMTNGTGAAGGVGATGIVPKKKVFSDYLDPTQKTAVQALGSQRTQQIIDNLQKGFKNDVNIFSSLDNYKKAYGYDQADPGKRAILDAYLKYNKPELLQGSNTGIVGGVANAGLSGPGIDTPMKPTDAAINQQTGTTAQNATLTPIAPLGNINLGSSTVKGTSLSAPSTGNAAFDRVGKSEASNANVYTAGTAQNTNIQNQNLTGIEQAAQTNQQDFESASAKASQDALIMAQNDAAIAKANTERQHLEDNAKYKTQLTTQETQNKRNLAAANLLASLTGGTGGTGEFAFVKDTEQQAIDSIRSIQDLKSATDTKYNTDLQTIAADLFKNISTVNTNYNNSILTSRSKFLDTLTTIETTKGKNTQAAYDAVYTATKDFTNTITNLTKEAENIKLDNLKLAETRRNNLIVEQQNQDKIKAEAQLNADKLSQQKLKDMNDFNIEKAKLRATTAKETGTPVDSNTIETLAQAMKAGTITGASGTITQLPLESQKKILDRYKELDPSLAVKQSIQTYNANIPQKMKDSNIQDAKYMNMAEEAINAGQSLEQYRNAQLGIKNKPENEFEISQVLGILKKGSSDTVLSNDQKQKIISNINDGNFKTAYNQAETAILNDKGLKDKYGGVNPNQYMNTYSGNMAEVQKALFAMGKDDQKAMGFIGSNINSILNAGIGEPIGINSGNPKVNDLMTKIGLLNAKERNELFGATVTGGEAKVSADFFPNAEVTYGTFLNRVNSVWNQKANEYNNVRTDSIYDLQPLDISSPGTLKFQLQNLDQVYGVNKPEETIQSGPIPNTSVFKTPQQGSPVGSYIDQYGRSTLGSQPNYKGVF